jgi:signal-transduction protein with cAMP-binding, CBS, and nucleotidyltransferase domain
MEIGVKAGDLMSRNFVYAAPSTNLKQCSEIMIKKRVGSLIIQENNNLKGILTEKDIVWAIVKKSGKNLDKIKASDLAKRKVVTIKPGADIFEALNKMKKEKIRRLPVLENGKVIGMLTLNDILKLGPGLFELILENMKIKEETEKFKQIKAKKKQGICEECGEFETLYDIDGEWVCSSCYNSR